MHPHLGVYELRGESAVQLNWSCETRHDPRASIDHLLDSDGDGWEGVMEPSTNEVNAVLLYWHIPQGL
jgi:hypothetical protein